MEEKVVSFKKEKVDVFESFDVVLSEINKNVRPSDRMICFYNFIGKLPRFLGIPLLLLTSADAWKVLFFAGLCKRTDAGIQVIYDYKIRPWRLFWALGDALWQNSYNCKSVRARGAFVREAVAMLVSETKNLSEFSKKPVLVSIGSGSAIQLFQGINENKLNNSVRIILVDRDKKALKRGRINAEKFDIGFPEFRKATIGRFFENISSENSVDIVEMVGLADYFSRKHLERYFGKIYRSLKKGGFFLGANITDEDEKYYAHGSVCWPAMHYRSEEEIREILHNSGFDYVWTGKSGLYTVWLGQKK